MTPLGIDRPTLTWPGYLGGIDWGGISVDKGRHLMFVNNNQVSHYNRLLTRTTADRLGVKPMTAAHMSAVGGPVPPAGELGRASCRDGVWPHVLLSVVGDSFKTK